ncbi:MAG: hypothetical protein V4645_27785 [Pseudomonadota bacterium]
MKTTVKLDAMTALVVEPDGARVALSITVGAIQVQRKALTLDQSGAILFAIEQAAEIAQRNAEAAAAQ